jgi:thioredoxin reductase (NADPH)
MITADELARIPLFAKLGAAELSYIARTAPDIRLVAGEYVVHEGESRALFITIEGRLQVVKLVDGVERVIGNRTHGALFGEVPMMLNAPFPAGLRAAEPSRVIRIGAKEFQPWPPRHRRFPPLSAPPRSRASRGCATSRASRRRRS